MIALQPGPLRRVVGLIRKESLQILRDPSSFLIAGLLPLLLLLIFGTGVSLDLLHVSVAVVVEAPTPEARSLLDSFRNSRYFAVREAATAGKWRPTWCPAD
jgi:ABC-2 type transport system permease protein